MNRRGRAPNPFTGRNRRGPTRLPLLGLVVLVVLLCGGSGTVAATARTQTEPGVSAIRFELVTDQLEQPVFVTHPGDGSGRLFVAEKRGRIAIVKDGVPLPRPFLDIHHQV